MIAARWVVFYDFAAHFLLFSTSGCLCMLCHELVAWLGISKAERREEAKGQYNS